MRVWFSFIAAASLCGCTPEVERTRASAPVCDSLAVVGNLPREISEASGIAIGRRARNRIWTHNDDGPPVLFALDRAGRLTGRVRIMTATAVDWEDIAIASCATGSCLYIADIGDNKQTGRVRVVYEITEPLADDSVARPVARYPFRLPGKPHDAEALAVFPDGRMLVITKGRSGPITVYAFPQPRRPGVEVELRPVATLSGGLVQLPDMVSGAAVTPDGRYLAIRTYSAVQFFRFNGDKLTAVSDQPFSIESLGEPQGEGIDITDAGEIFLVSERGLEKSAPLSRLLCQLPD